MAYNANGDYVSPNSTRLANQNGNNKGSENQYPRPKKTLSATFIIFFVGYILIKMFSRFESIGLAFALVPIAVVLMIVIFAVVAVMKNRKQQQGATFKEKQYFDAVQEMEPGYVASTDSLGEKFRNSSKFAKVRVKPLTAEEYKRKKEELDDLVAAGIITSSERANKLEEYRYR